MAALTMLRKWALSVPVAWWYSMTQQLLRISPLLSLLQGCAGQGERSLWEVQLPPPAGPAPHPDLPHRPSAPALPAGALVLQQGLGLLLADDGGLHLGGVHVHVQLPPHQEPHGGCELGLCLQHLGGLLLDDEGAGGGHRGQGQAGLACPPTPPGAPAELGPRHYLVTRAEMMSVMVLFSSDSISSTGPGIGSCWHKCSARRICCRFCQMISASFSHLGGAGLSTAPALSTPPRLAGHPPALQHVQGALGGAPVPRELLPTLPLDQLIVQDGCLLLAQQLQCLLVFLGQVL